MKSIPKLSLFFAIFYLSPVAAHAYIGPGTGLSAIGSILAFLGVILLLVIGFLWYPIKRLRNHGNEKDGTSQTTAANSQTLDESSDESSSLP